MFALPFHLVTIAIIVWGLTGWPYFHWVFLAWFAAVALWVLGTYRKVRLTGIEPGTDPYHFTADEIAVLRRHPVYFLAPAAAMTYAAIFSFMGLGLFACIGVLLYRHWWLEAVLFVLLYPVTMHLNSFVNPGRWLRYNAARLMPEQAARLALIDSIDEKLRTVPYEQYRATAEKYASGQGHDAA